MKSLLSRAAYLQPISILIILITTNCSSPKSHDGEKLGDMHKVEWLLGCWKGVDNDQVFYECWQKENDTFITNRSIFINGTDTVVETGSPLRLVAGEMYLGEGNQIWKIDSVTTDFIRARNDTLQGSKMIRWKHGQDDHWLTLRRNGDTLYDMVRVNDLLH